MRIFKYAAIPVLLLSLLAIFRIWEQDIYWLIRDGQEMLRTFSLPNGDKWSFSAPGGTWINTYWLSAITFGLVERAGGSVALVISRALILGAVLSTAFYIFLSASRTTDEDGRLRIFSLAAAWAFLPILYFALIPRIQLRPDFLIILLFAALTLIWTLDKSEKWKAIGGCTVCLLAANFHQGASLAVIGYFCFLVLLSELRTPVKVGWCVAALTAYFVTPNFAHTLKYIRTMGAIFDHSSLNVIENPDFGPFQLSYLNFGVAGWAGWSILTWTAYVAYCVFQKLRSSNTSWRTYAEAGFLVLLAALSFYRERLMPFFLIASIPIIAKFTASKFKQGRGEQPKPISMAIMIIWIGLIPLQMLNDYRKWGVTPDETVYPIGSVDFIKRSGAKAEIYHDPSYGNYLIHFLPSHRVFIDTREVPYKDVHREMAKAFSAPSLTHALLEKYRINTVLMPQHIPGLKGPGTFIDQVGDFYPTKDWALVFFDSISMVLVRRIPEHLPLIEKQEYRLIKPHIPPGAVLDQIKSNPDEINRFKLESARCLIEGPNNWVCAAAAGELARLENNTATKNEMIEKLISIGENRGFSPFLRATLDRLEQ